jgi:Family of unknown function (DUF5681)
MTKTPNPEPGNLLPATGNYTVGYKKPPTEHQFKPGHLRDGSQKASEKAPDIAALFDKPLKVKRGGKTVAMHPFEAELTSLGKRALKGEPRAMKLFVKHCEDAGLLEPPPAEQTHGVFVIPRGVNRGILHVLLETYGLPPWDRKIYAALEAEFERDQARIEELYIQFLKEHENEPQN